MILEKYNFKTFSPWVPLLNFVLRHWPSRNSDLEENCQLDHPMIMYIFNSIMFAVTNKKAFIYLCLTAVAAIVDFKSVQELHTKFRQHKDASHHTKFQTTV